MTHKRFIKSEIDALLENDDVLGSDTDGNVLTIYDSRGNAKMAFLRIRDEIGYYDVSNHPYFGVGDNR